MRFATFSVDELKRLGAVLPGADRLVDLDQACYQRTGSHDRRLRTMRALVAAGPEALIFAQSVLDHAPRDSILGLSSVKLHSPLEPVALRCCSVFEDHYRDAHGLGGGFDRIDAMTIERHG